MELALIAIGLSMDAFAVSLCKGLCMKKLNYRQSTIIALFFGGFQMMMPLLGWVLGKQFERYITTVDHWIAFVLLASIATGVNVYLMARQFKTMEGVMATSLLLSTVVAAVTTPLCVMLSG